MARIRILVVALLALAAPWGAAGAATLGDAKVGFTAERILTFDGKTFVGRMWNMPGKQRHEQDLNAWKPVFILHADTAFADVVVPQLHTVVQLPFPPELAVLTSGGLLRKPLGKETVNGIATTKYAIDETVSSGHALGTLWLSSDGIPMKLDGRFVAKNGHVTKIGWELKHVEIGPQPASLFEPPADYSKLPPEAVASLLGLKVKIKPSGH
ncbi:MAG TPA: hypothetical protein VFA12_17690 [Stellaceae bacterium]|nr:hypothetical protein [Stellaceae bacterium]